MKNEQSQQNEEVLDKVLTAPNIITFIRLLLIPVYVWLLFGLHQEIAALVVFAIAACTDWVDGQVARRFNQVSKLGKLFDPLVDRLLIATGVISMCIIGRLPLWIPILLVVRDLVLLLEGQIMLRKIKQVPSVVYPGKIATALLLFGFCFLMFGAPYVPELGLFELSWLPGFGFGQVLLGIYFVYIGIIFSLATFIIYQIQGVKLYLCSTSKDL